MFKKREHLKMNKDGRAEILPMTVFENFLYDIKNHKLTIALYNFVILIGWDIEESITDSLEKLYHLLIGDN